MAQTTTTLEFTDQIEGYWIPGCSSCLRMKEFLQKSGLPFEAINLELSPGGRAKLEHFDMRPPVVVVGDRAVSGLDLIGVAELIGIDYTPPAILPPAELAARYRIVQDTMRALISQLSDEQLQYKSPDRDRTMAELGAHIASIMRCFVDVYDNERYNHAFENPEVEPTTSAEIVAISEETSEMFETWWKRFGFDDPLDRVVETSWGARTLHEAMERSVWHPMQHTRQLTYFVEERIGITPARRLTAEDMAGLPLPDGIHAGGEDA